MADHVLVTIDPKQVADLKQFVRQEIVKVIEDLRRPIPVEQPGELQKLKRALVALAAELERKTDWVGDGHTGYVLDEIAIARRLRELAR